MKVGRNDPCPCGSDKKFKRCCMEEGDFAADDVAETINAEIRQAISGRAFSSLDELNAVVAEVTSEQNRRALSAFCGLSPEQMSKLLSHPFESPDVVVFDTALENVKQVPVMSIAMALFEAMGEKGLKATAKGFLPIQCCKQLRESLGPMLEEQGIWINGGLRSEQDFDELYATRVIAVMAGLMRKYKGHFVLTKKGRALIDASAWGEIYYALFRAYCAQFNWAYRDGYPESEIVQISFLYTLYLLLRFGQQALPTDFYTEKFLEAYPTALNDFDDSTYFTPEETLANAFSLRALDRFGNFFGLINLRRDEQETPGRRMLVQKTRLLDQFVTFMVDVAVQN